MFAVVLCEGADLGPAPTVDREVEGRTRLDARNKARHDGEAGGSMAMGELCVRDDLTGHSELLERYMPISTGWEEEDIPAIVPHGESIGGLTLDK